MSQPAVEHVLEGILFTWPDLPYTITLARIRESATGTRAELTVQVTNGSGKLKTLLHRSVDLLKSKLTLTKELSGKYDAPWASMFEQASILTLRDLRHGNPVESLVPGPDSA